MINRRKFLKTTTVAGAGIASLPLLACANEPKVPNSQTQKKPFAGAALEERIHQRVMDTFPSPIIIDKIEVIDSPNVKKRFFCRITDKEGNTGVSAMNKGRFRSSETIFTKLAAMNFIGKDARNIAHLPDEILKMERNYKFVSLPYWNAIGTIEIALWDLLGKIANRPAYTFLGDKKRNAYKVYISSLEREKPYEGETERVLKTLEATGAKAVKFKIGGRMKNTEPYIKRTNDWVPYMRKKVGENITLYVDGNSSYTADEAIEVLKMIESYGIEFFEEPCYWQDLWSHKLVKDAATSCKIAGGEQDFSFDQFKLMAQIGAMDTLQPDVYYFGGIVRTLKISYLADYYGLGFTPHSPKSGPMAAAPNQVFAVCPVLSHHQEYRVGGEETQKDWHSPVIPKNGELAILEKPGLGIEYDDGIWKKEKIYWISKNS
ncbi:mandelate racemase/muconate lactonizing enzyme family protein [Winogradskyella sp.]|uniref:mandelate racemase/muconate lactonizing enzyme family protein n=1 Tax=Winogradskyella sp. TaxID=1883156 RepID=UPI00261464FF|nr:mandelate racemase/muconate lactonizing enzyme family protein [Winogradskyella sp.]